MSRALSVVSNMLCVPSLVSNDVVHSSVRRDKYLESCAILSKAKLSVYEMEWAKATLHHESFKLEHHLRNWIRTEIALRFSFSEHDTDKIIRYANAIARLLIRYIQNKPINESIASDELQCSVRTWYRLKPVFDDQIEWCDKLGSNYHIKVSTVLDSELD